MLVVESARDEETPDDDDDNIEHGENSDYLDKEDEHGNISGDGNSNVKLDGLDLIGRKQTRSHGNLTAVDCPEHRED